MRPVSYTHLDVYKRQPWFVSSALVCGTALVIDAPGETEAAVGAEEAAASAAERAVELVAEGLRTKEVTKHLVAEFGISRNDAYNLAMEAAR